jgi:uncharacterized RDD family membrane protein YckC
MSIGWPRYATHSYGMTIMRGGAMSAVVSGEAVVLDLRPARAASRGIGFFLDAIVQIALLVALTLGAATLSDTFGGDIAVTGALSLVAVVIALVGYPLLFETLTRGKSLGKLALGMRVVRQDGGAVRARHSLVRALFGVIELWATFGVVAFIASLSSAQGKRLGDQFAGTLVVLERAPRSTDVAWTMPPRMAPWAMQADLSRLPDALALEIRTFLLRTPDLEPNARWSLSVRLADAVRQCTTPPPPLGIGPEEYLVAVLAERRRRASG